MPRRLGKNPEIYNIPAHQSFVDVLARGVIDRFGNDPIELSKVLILLPNRRAVRSLREAFLRLTGGKATILPSMQPIGDVDEDGLVMAGGAHYDDLDLLPAVPTHVRQMILMNIIHDWHKNEKLEIPDNANCAVLAEALGHFLDQVQTENIDFANLDSIVPENYAIHWQQTTNFLKILSEHWPDLLSVSGYMDSALRRNQLLHGLRANWLSSPPGHPIIAAGSTGSIKATSDLLQVIARLPQGMVVLPGIDQNIDDRSWDAIDDTHPQATMKQLLEVIQVGRIEIENWDGSDPANTHEITGLFREIMRPSQTTDLWRDLNIPALKTIKQIVTPGRREEAGIIALMMREQLEKKGKTAALVTPDRILSRQVIGELRRWNIEVDDSAGTPLFNKPVGVFLRLSAQMVSEKLAPVALMSTLKHPLSAGGRDIASFKSFARSFEQIYLRGPRPASGLAGVDEILNHQSEFDDQISSWWDSLKAIIQPFDSSMRNDGATFEQLLLGHIDMAEKLAATNEISGADRLWKGDDGEAAAKLIEDLLAAAPYVRHFKPDQYSALFEQFMNSVNVRSKYGQHPRLNIWGPLEARLQHADLMILAGLNENVWPAEPGNDPWMSRPMRKDFGLPGLEQRIGLSAHDFVQTASAENVVITRAEKNDGTPTVKSRWLNRLHAIIGSHQHENESAKWLSWYARLDKPANIIEIEPPEPKPPVNARPRALSVTRVELWMKDPYSLYAEKILNLKKLDELDQDPGAIDKGIIIHDILDDFMSRYQKILPEDAEEALIKIGKQYFAEHINRPTVRAFWWPRFKQIAKWFINIEKERRTISKTVLSESKGKIDIALPSGNFELSAKADRIDRFDDGTISIIDYKTGQPPRLRQLKAGFAPQLPLEAAIAINGGFSLLDKSTVSELAYWQLSGGEPAGRITFFNEAKKVDVMKEAQNAFDGVVALIETFDKLETPYLNKPRPEAVGYGEYDHLARTKEWGDG